MAVYTDVAAEDLDASSPATTSASCSSYKGIAEGVENSNFLLHTARGYFILTLYEKRVAPADLPFFLGADGASRQRAASPARSRCTNRDGDALGKLAGRPAAIVTFLDGMWIRRPSAAPLRRGRRGAGAAASGRRGFPDAARQRALGRRLAAAVRAGRRRAPTACSRGSAMTSPRELDRPREELAARPAAGRHPRRPVPRQRVLSRRQSCPA